MLYNNCVMVLEEKEKIIAGSNKVKICGNRVFRYVDNIDDAKKIIEVSQNKLGDGVVGTKVFSEEENLLEHEFISPIIHSGEYTESMAYDVTEIALNTAIKMAECGVYSFDLLPHNYTYHNGKWILYDFGAFEMTPKNVKTQVRGCFKICFSAFELSKIIQRKYLKHYYLNRIKTSALSKMIPVWCFVCLELKSLVCKLLYSFGFYKQAYVLLERILESYKKNFVRKVYEPKNFASVYTLDGILEQNAIYTSFIAGKNSVDYAAASGNDAKKFVYIEDYSLCDEFYNYIYRNGRAEISTAVLYPMVQDEEIPQEYHYRALYDSFAQERFESEAVVITNYSEFFDIDEDVLLKNLSRFGSKLMVLGFSCKDEKYRNISEKITIYYKSCECIESDDGVFLVGKNRIDFERKLCICGKEYTNNNRRECEVLHSEKILEILKKS